VVPSWSFCSTAFITAGWQCPGHQRTEAEVVVDVFVAVEVVNAATFAILHKKWIGLVMAIVAGNAGGMRSRARLWAAAGFRRALS